MANITEEFLGNTGLLQIQNGVALDSTLRVVTDQSNITSTLYLSRNQVKIGSVSNDTPLALFGNKNISAIFNTIQLTGSDKTFTFPDVSMTFAGINIGNTFSATNTFTVAQTFNNEVSAQSFRLTGTGGAGHLHLKFQSGDPTISSSTTTVLYGDSVGNLRLKNGANNWWTTFSTSANSQDSTYTFPNVPSTTLAGLAVAQTFTLANIFSAAGAASTPALSLTGTPFVGNGTTSVPLFYLNGGAAPTTWNSAVNGGTYIGINATSAFAGNFIEFRQNGGASIFSINVFGGFQTGVGATNTFRGNIQLQNSFTIINKANVSYLTFMTRNTTAAEVVMDLTNIGTIAAAGAISIGNTVASGVGVASTHKVTMVIGGTTYYLLASNV
jgi:hypothetical protein